jgi:hypothetical protein
VAACGGCFDAQVWGRFSRPDFDPDSDFDFGRNPKVEQIRYSN